jgi:hypothetical protein
LKVIDLGGSSQVRLVVGGWWLVFEMAQFPSEPSFAASTPAVRLFYPAGTSSWRAGIISSIPVFQHSLITQAPPCTLEQRHDNFKHITTAVKKQD